MSIDTKARPIERGSHDHAYWLADKIPALGDYAKEAAWLLRDQADRFAALEDELNRVRADRDAAAKACAMLFEDKMKLKAERDAAQAEARGLRERLGRLLSAMDAIRQYGSDTLSGRVDGPDDRAWQRAAVIEMTRRTNAALSLPAAEQDGLCIRCEGMGKVPVDEDFGGGTAICGRCKGDGGEPDEKQQVKQPAERESLPLIDEEYYDEPFETAAGACVEADWDLARELGKERKDG